ncbi:MAG TPA: hypothetical protein VIF34_15180 [Methylocystis sp.]|jgi:hypothetical protein
MAALGGLAGNLSCRPIEEADLDDVVSCLCRGFPARSRAYWECGLARLAARPQIESYPRFGYKLEDAGKIVGVLLGIFSYHGEGEAKELHCNLSSWCVDAAYRKYGSRLAFAAFRHKGVIFTNISPKEETWPVAAGFGFYRYCDGQFVFVPALSLPRREDRILDYRPDLPVAAALSEGERQILEDHAALGCDSMICVGDGAVFPLVLRRKTLMGFVRARQIVYCRDVTELPRYAGALGRKLLRQGDLLCVVDENGPVAGLAGRFFLDRGPKYFRGAKAPRLGDLAYTEVALFGT